jgi:Flp pilus assembly protein TadG
MNRVGRWVGSVMAKRLHGQAAVETAAVFAIIVPVLLGAVDLGRAYFNYDLLVHAANEGARRGSFDPSAGNIVATVQAAANPMSLQTSDVTITCYSGSSTTTKTCSLMTTGDSVRVMANVVFTPLTPLISAIISGGTLTLSATAQRTFQ